MVLASVLGGEWILVEINMMSAALLGSYRATVIFQADRHGKQAESFVPVQGEETAEVVGINIFLSHVEQTELFEGERVLKLMVEEDQVSIYCRLIFFVKCRKRAISK